MKHWLVTASTSIDRAALANELGALGCDLSEGLADPQPLNGDEEVYQVIGPDDLPKKLQDKPGIKGIFPDSEYTLY